MTDDGAPRTHRAWIAALNELTAEEFGERLAEIFEYSPWVAESAAGERPFGSIDDLHEALMALVQALPEAEIDAFLRGHPELGATDTTGLTNDSAGEQSRAGLIGLCAEQSAELRTLNAAYRERHGFPLVIAVGDLTTSEVLAEMAARQDRGTDVERETALQQVSVITRMRLERLARRCEPR